MIVALQRDPFARATLLRDIVLHAGYKPCKWCGNPRGRFMYKWETDSIYTRSEWDGLYCSVGCYRTYNSQS